jgi:hypothetical protein
MDMYLLQGVRLSLARLTGAMFLFRQTQVVRGWKQIWSCTSIRWPVPPTPPKWSRFSML